MGKRLHTTDYHTLLIQTLNLKSTLYFYYDIMRFSISSVIATLLAAASATPMTRATKDFQSDMLASHNYFRAQHSANPLTWDFRSHNHLRHGLTHAIFLTVALARILSTGPASSIGASLPTCGVVSASNITLINQPSPLPLGISLNSCGKTRRLLAVLGHIVVAVPGRLLATMLSAGIAQQEISKVNMPTKSVAKSRAVLAMFILET